MEDLFRFFVVRPPSNVAANRVIALEQPTEFVDSLHKVLEGETPVPRIREVVRRFASEGYTDAVDKLRLGAALQELDAILLAVGPIEQLQDTDAALAIHAAFNLPAVQIVGLEEFKRDRTDLWDAIIAIKLLRSEQAKPFADLVRALRLLVLIERLARNDPDMAQNGAVASILALPIQLPPTIFPLPHIDPPKTDPSVHPEEREEGKRLAAAREEAAQLRGAIDELTLLDPGSFIEDAPQGADQPVRPSQPTLNETSLFRMFTVQRRVAAAGAFSPPLTPERLFTVKQEVVNQLSEATRSTIQKSGQDPTQVRMDRMVTRLEIELQRRLKTIAELEPLERTRNVAFIGSTAILTPIQYLPWLPQRGRTPLPATSSVPDTHGTLRSVGVADLLIVKQHLKRYQARDIAHIENVLNGELKLREHRRATTTEEIVLTERETTTEEEHELESTERFEMQQEVSEVIKEDARLEAGLKISGKYGIAVEFETYANGATSNSKERSTQHASQYASEVTSRSASRITERFREQITRRILREVEETNRHELNNVTGDDHVVGIYQWIEKVYEAQVYNYGIRTLYDLMLPEPAAFLIAALKQNVAESTGLEQPPEFTLKPNQIIEDDYHKYVRDYEATGVEPPPEPYVTVSKVFRAGPDSGESETRGAHVDSTELVIPDGYQAIYGHAVLAGANYWDSRTEYFVDLSIGRKRRRFVEGGAWEWSTTLSNETTSIPLALSTWRVMNFSLAVEVRCLRTARAREQWQQQTHSAILLAYQKKRSAYEEQLAALQAQVGIQISGRHPQANRLLERDEIKKGCITLLTRQHYELFGAIQTGNNGLPQLDLEEAEPEGTYIRFFEQAFEWENITYVFYPYFWGRKEAWVERINYQDVDPLFEAFLKAGSARVIVPVRPGFEAAIDHFMSTGQTWSGGELPDVTSDVYVPITQEIREQTGAPGNEVPQGDPWEVVVPTTLVYLRQDATLPAWRKNAQGEWVSVENNA